MRAFRIQQLSGEIYHDFMDAGFRRSGNIIYQPICSNCQMCVPIRVPVDRFMPTKSQRRSLKRNADLTVTVGQPQVTQEKIAPYQRYISIWHGTVEADDSNSLEQFLYQSPVKTLEFCYRTSEQKLIGVGIADVCARSFSSVYFYFDPDERARGIGTFSALHEMQFCQKMAIPFYYLGYWVNGCDKMQYKSSFQPAEYLRDDGVWTEMPDLDDDIEND